MWSNIAILGLSYTHHTCVVCAADLIEIEEVALLSKGKEWDEKIYVVSGPVMDGVRSCLLYSYTSNSQLY